MRNHTLMQTIARANRKAEGKTSGVIVDYVGVFKNLQKALAVYAGGPGSEGGEGPIKDKQALVTALEEALGAAGTFLEPLQVDTGALMATRDLERLKLISKAVDVLVAPDERRREFGTLSFVGMLVRPIQRRSDTDSLMLSET